MKLFKSILIVSLMIASGISQANPHHGNRHHGHHGANRVEWIVPFAIGSAVVYTLTRPTPQPVVVQQPSIPSAPYGFHYKNILDANCNCYRLVLVQN